MGLAKKFREYKLLIVSKFISSMNVGVVMCGRIKTEPSLSADANNYFEGLNSYDVSLMEKMKTIEPLSNEEKKTVFTIADVFFGKKKLKYTLRGALQNVK